MQIVNQRSYLNYNIIEYDIVSSTMDVIKDFAENTVIVAQKQENSRGKAGRVWQSQNGDNLYFSLNLLADKKNLDYSQLSFVSSVAMRQAIKEYDKNNNLIVSKWPNDILINNKKTTGILLEFDYMTKILIIGIGVNINFFPDNTMFKATSLKQENIIVNRYDLLKSFLKNFNFLFKQWEQNGFEIIRDKWLESCYKLNQEIEVNSQKGIFKDIDRDGTLILELDNGENIFVRSGDVF